MKIVCQSCSAKYSIADDKVQGKKVFKIKCKKCGEDILVRGAEGGAEADASAGHPAAAHEQFSEDEATRVVSNDTGDAVWHAVVNGENQGPFSMMHLRDMLANGSIDPEAFVWKDGFGDWKPMREVPELAMLVPGSVGAPAAMPASSGGDALFGGPAPAAAARSSGGGGGGGMFASAPSEAKARAGSKAAAGGDLFGGGGEPAKPMFGGGEEEVSSASKGGGGGGVGMGGGGGATGQRNENSVLFSLATLQQVSGAGSSAKVSEPGAASKNNGDQSGLIDIKSMASTFGPSSSKSKAVDDILTVGGGGALSSPLSAPMLSPVATPQSHNEPQQSSGTNKTVLFSVIAVAVILAGGGIAVAFLMKGNQPPPAAIAAPVAPVAPVVAPVAAPVAPVAPVAVAPTAAPAAGGTVAESGGNGGGNAGGGGGGGGRGGARRGSSGGGGGGNTATAANSGSGSTTASTGAAPAGGGGGGGSPCAQRCHGNIDCLLRCSTQGPAASSGGGGGGGAPSNAPEMPQRNDVISAMRGVAGAVSSCANGQAGTASIAITFASSGRVTTANVGAPYAGTPAGSCMARAVRAATVPAFSRPTFTVNYPFSVR